MPNDFPHCRRINFIQVVKQYFLESIFKHIPVNRLAYEILVFVRNDMGLEYFFMDVYFQSYFDTVQFYHILKIHYKIQRRCFKFFNPEGYHFASSKGVHCYFI